MTFSSFIKTLTLYFVTTLFRGTVPDPSCPHCLVQLGVNTHIGGLHLLIRKLFDGFDGTRGSSLKPTEKNKQTNNKDH